MDHHDHKKNGLVIVLSIAVIVVFGLLPVLALLTLIFSGGN